MIPMQKGVHTAVLYALFRYSVFDCAVQQTTQLRLSFLLDFDRSPKIIIVIGGALAFSAAEGVG